MCFIVIYVQLYSGKITCDMCKKVVSRHNLPRHLRKCNNEKAEKADVVSRSLMCDVCAEVFDSGNELKTHKERGYIVFSFFNQYRIHIQLNFILQF